MESKKRSFYDFGKWTRKLDFYLLFSSICIVFMASFSLHAATPGLPFIEDFSDNDLNDRAKTSAEWSTAEKEVYLAWRNKIYGVMSEPVVMDVGGAIDETCAVVLGDINGDGLLDMVAGNNGRMNKLYLNSGTGIPFNQDTVINITTDVDDTWSLALGDVDGDGDLDVVTGNSGQTNKLYLNDGDGDPFDTTIGTEIGSDEDNTLSIVLGDVDGDGDLDVVVGNSGQTNKLYLNDGDGDPFDTVIGTTIGSDGNDTRSVALGDVNGDGKIDVVAGNYGQLNLLYLNDWNGDPFDTIAGTSISTETNDTMAIALGDMDGDGELDVIDSRRQYLNDGDGDPFDTATGSPIGSPTATALALADFDGDGDLDIIGGQWDEETKLIIRDGNGGYESLITIGTDTDSTYSIAIGDVNGDEKLDVVTGNYYGQMNKLYLNNGKGDQFDSDTIGTLIGVDTNKTYDIAVGDMDGDGDLDVVAGNYGENKLYLNDGKDDPFDTVTGTSITQDADCTVSIAVGDIDGDGNLDVVTGNTGAMWSLPGQTNKYYLNDGEGDPFDTVITGTSIGSDTDDTRSIALGDMDGDGDLDVVTGNSNQTNKLYLNDSEGDLFASAMAAPIGSGADITSAIAVGDMDRDGDLDVVAGNYDQINRLYLNDGEDDPFDTAGMGTPIGSVTGDTTAIAVADLDGDGDLDVVEGEYLIRLYLNDGEGDPFDPDTGVIIGSGGAWVASISIGDVDGDGNLDVVSGSHYSTEKRLYLNDGEGPPFDNATGDVIGADEDRTYSVAIGDMDGDGDLDVVAGNYDQTNKLYINDADAGRYEGITGKIITWDTNYTLSIALGDLDGDGTLDLVVGNSGQFQPNKTYLNDGDIDPFDTVTGTLIDEEWNTIYTRSVAVGDINGDGKLDVVAGNGGSNKLYLNDGDGNLTATYLDANNDHTYATAIGDINGDGDLDVIAGNYGQPNKLYLNDGDENPFDTVSNIQLIGTESDHTLSIALGDIDGDGDLDVVAGDDSYNILYLNDGNGDPFDTVGAGISIFTGYLIDRNPTYSVALGDVDGDGDLDLVAGNSYSTIGAPNMLYLNDGDGDPFDTLTTGIPIGTDADIDQTKSLALGDIDGDGDLDLVVGNDGQANKLYLNGNVGLPFATPGIPIGTDIDSTYSIVLGDVDGDGALDIVTGNDAGTNKVYFHGGYNTAHGLVTSLEIDTETENNISNATLVSDEVLQINTNVEYFLSNNGGEKFYKVRPGVEFMFPTVGNDLRWRAELSSMSPKITPRINEIGITIRNTRPEITGGQTLSYVEDDPPVVIDETITVTDIDNVKLASATIKFGAGYQNGEDILGFADASGITGSWDQAFGELTLTGEAPVSQYEAALRSVTYENVDKGNPTEGERAIIFSVNDGTNDSTTVTSTINVTRTNDPPVITGHDPNPASITQNGSIEVIMSDQPAPSGKIHLVVEDPDNNFEDLYLIIQSGDNYVLQGNTITPVENFFGEISVPLIVYDGDDYGDEYVLNIQVEDITDPTVSGVAVQVGGLTVDVTFSEPMGSGVTSAVNYELSGDGKGTLSTRPDTVENLYNNTYQLTWLSGEMLSGGDIVITVSGIEDASGRSIGTPNSGTDMGGGIGNPPATSADPAGGHHYDVQEVELECVDMGSGCEAIYYTTDGSEPTTSSSVYSEPIPIEAYRELRFFSLDKAGNQESIQTEVYHIDIPTTITCDLEPPGITLGESLVITGEISPAPTGPASGLGIRLFPPDVTDPAMAIQIPVESHTGGSFEKYIVCDKIDIAGDWKAETTWEGDTSHLGATSFIKDLSVSKADSRLDLGIVMEEAIKINNEPPIGGKFTALPFCEDGNLSYLEIELTITEPPPSGNVHNLHATTNEHGQFVLDYADSGFAFNKLGLWTIKASFQDNDNYPSAESETIRVRVVPTAGYAVIIQGKSDSGEGLASHLKTTDFVYEKLTERQLLPGDIDYFSWDISSPNWDGLPFKANIETAITETMRDKMIANAGDLYIVMIDHGWTLPGDDGEGVFYIHPDEPITSSELAGWLDELQYGENGLAGTAAEDRKIVLILGFCRAGASIDEISGPNRVLIASAAEDEYSHRGPQDVKFVNENETTPLRDGEYFVTEFFKAISFGESVTESFKTATALTEIYTATGSGLVNAPYYDDSSQHPLFEDNEDGWGSNEISYQEGEDGYNSEYLFIGTSPPKGNDPGDVLITDVSGARFLGENDTQVDLWAEVDIPEQLKMIWAELKAPDYDPGDPGAGQQIEMETFKKATTDVSGNVYEWNAIGGGSDPENLFDIPGTYQVFYFAKDLESGHVSPLMAGNVYKARPDVWGPFEDANRPPESFSLIYPENGVTVMTTVMLDWEDTTDPEEDVFTYTVVLSKGDDTFTNTIRKEGLQHSACMLNAADGVEDLSTYYWKVIAVDQYGAYTESNETWEFYTDNKNGPSISLVYVFVYDELGNFLSNAIVNPGNRETNSIGMSTLVLTSGIHTVTATVPSFEPKSQTHEFEGGEYHLHFVFPSAVGVIGDTDGDGDVDGSDLATLASCFASDFGRDDCSEESPCDCDLDGDNTVDQADLDVFAGGFGG